MTGRSKDIINRGGEKFSAQDIETALVACPQIAMAAVVGAPDARFGQVVAAFVTLRAGIVWGGPEPVVAHLEAAKVAKQKMPVRWQVVDQIPTTATGKVQKQLLIAMLTFGDVGGYGATPQDAAAMLDLYIGAGGNFIDTANIYALGGAEAIVADALAGGSHRRGKLVVATKFSANTGPRDLNAGGASRASIVSACEQSLRRFVSRHACDSAENSSRPGKRGRP